MGPPDEVPASCRSLLSHAEALADRSESYPSA